METKGTMTVRVCDALRFYHTGNSNIRLRMILATWTSIIH